MKNIRKIKKWKRRIAAVVSTIATISALYNLYVHYSGEEWINKIFKSIQSESQKKVTADKIPMDSADAGLMVEFIDVGQGDCILVYEKKSDATMLIDTGKYEAYDNVQSVLLGNGIDHLEYFVVTHMDSDHMQSASDILEDYEVDTLLCANDLDKDTECVQYLKETYPSKVDEIIFPAAGDTYNLGNADITVMGPAENNKDSYEDSNEYSIMLKVGYEEISYLFTGDADENEYLDVKAEGMDFSDIDVVKMMHHGSAQDGSNSKEFLRDTDAQYAVISCGYGNQYGHPHREVVKTLSDLGVSTFRTDLQGSIISVTDGKNIIWNVEPTTNFKSGSELGSIY